MYGCKNLSVRYGRTLVFVIYMVIRIDPISECAGHLAICSIVLIFGSVFPDDISKRVDRLMPVMSDAFL